MTPGRRGESPREMTRGPDMIAWEVRFLGACPCGCKLPDRMEIELGGTVIHVDDPVEVDTLIAEMKVGREKLWGQPPGGAR